MQEQTNIITSIQAALRAINEGKLVADATQENLIFFDCPNKLIKAMANTFKYLHPQDLDNVKFIIRDKTVEVSRSTVIRVLSERFNAMKYGEIIDDVLKELGFEDE